MSTYMNSHLNADDILAQARAHRAKVVGDGIATGVRFLATKFSGAVQRLHAMQKQRAAVAQLMAMDERMLQDIGLNRSLVPFVVAGGVKNSAAELFADANPAANANDNAFRRAA